MVRISKQGERRNRFSRRPKLAGKKTGPQKDQLAEGYKAHPNALSEDQAKGAFIPKIL